MTETTATPVSITASITPNHDVSLERNVGGEWHPITKSAEIRQREYVTANPSDDVRAVEQDRVAIGTLYLDPATGTAYRLTGYYTDWTNERATEPSYSMLLPEGAQSRTTELPEGALAIWSPAAI